MNDFQMSSLASSRTNALLAEAQRQRLAGHDTPSGRKSAPSWTRRSLRFGLGSLLGRASA